MLADLRGLQLLNEIRVASCAAAAAWRGRDLPFRPPLSWTSLFVIGRKRRRVVTDVEGGGGKERMEPRGAQSTHLGILG